MPGGARFRFSVTPDLFRVIPSTTAHEYLAVHAVESEFGEVTQLHLWRYADGLFVEEIAVLDASALETVFGARSTMARTFGVIFEDPAGLVGPSLMWGDFTFIHLYDIDGATYYKGTTLAASPSPENPIWGGDGWIYYAISPVDGGETEQSSLRKIRGDMTGDVEVSALAEFGDSFFGMAHLTSDSYYAYSPDGDQIVVFPRDGSAPSAVSAGGLGLVTEPYHIGLPVASGGAIFLRGAGNGLRLGRFTGPATEAILWPADWADWEDPAGASGDVLSLSLNPAGTEAIVYAALASGGSTRGILRTNLEAKGGGDPVPIVEVSQHEGSYPDFMFALD